jgi:hypothetical protein
MERHSKTFWNKVADITGKPRPTAQEWAKVKDNLGFLERNFDGLMRAYAGEACYPALWDIHLGTLGTLDVDSLVDPK